MIPTEHARYVYNLQESESQSEESDISRSDTDDLSYAGPNTRRRRRHGSSKPRMSILSNQYFDFSLYDTQCAPNKTTKRRFFQSAARWDEASGRVLVGNRGVETAPRPLNLSGVMEAGGRSLDVVAYEPVDDSC